jgi:hypothetical protein
MNLRVDTFISDELDVFALVMALQCQFSKLKMPIQGEKLILSPPAPCTVNNVDSPGVHTRLHPIGLHPARYLASAEHPFRASRWSHFTKSNVRVIGNSGSGDIFIDRNIEKYGRAWLATGSRPESSGSRDSWKAFGNRRLTFFASADGTLFAVLIKAE